MWPDTYGWRLNGGGSGCGQVVHSANRTVYRPRVRGRSFRRPLVVWSCYCRAVRGGRDVARSFLEGVSIAVESLEVATYRRRVISRRRSPLVAVFLLASGWFSHIWRRASGGGAGWIRGRGCRFCRCLSARHACARGRVVGRRGRRSGSWCSSTFSLHTASPACPVGVGA